MANRRRAMPLRNPQSASHKTAPAPANGRHVKGPRVNGKTQRGKPHIPGAQFIAREQILPFDKMVFGLVDPYDRGVRIFRVEKYVNRNDRILLAWKRSKSWLTGRYIHVEVKEDGSRRIAVQTLAWDETATKPKNRGHMEFEWYDLGPKDLLAVEVAPTTHPRMRTASSGKCGRILTRPLRRQSPTSGSGGSGSPSRTRHLARGLGGMSCTLIRWRRLVPRHGWRASKSRMVSDGLLSGLCAIYGRGSPSLTCAPART
jgi:hypothetical protein